eukprot:COSAG06_NODE_9227_length_1953_cov_4.038296_1_plen_154_part_00
MLMLIMNVAFRCGIAPRAKGHIPPGAMNFNHPPAPPPPAVVHGTGIVYDPVKKMLSVGTHSNPGAQNAFFERFHAETDHLAKTGWGQTQGKSRKRGVLFRRPRHDAAQPQAGRGADAAYLSGWVSGGGGCKQPCEPRDVRPEAAQWRCGAPTR